MESFYKIEKDLELSLSKARKGWKEAKDDLWEMRHENLELSKEYEMLVDDIFSILHVSFENAMQQM